ncbi:hypothetical protein JNJ66_02170 [Candidatus Saccharibacteria bacterium]|nr:hypothetical protein [Candidatus Saccharibacteria bacterium]
MKKVASGIVVVLVLILGLNLGQAALDPPLAHASSTVCATYGNKITIPGTDIKAPNGQFCSTVDGNGTYIYSVWGTFGTFVPVLNQVCSPSMKIEIYDKDGTYITSRQGPTGSGCGRLAVNTVPPVRVYWDFPAAKGGFARVMLQGYGKTVATTEHHLQ